jgi:DNA adenine methylase
VVPAEIHFMKQYKTPLRYPGGKQKLAPFIAEILAVNDLVGGHYAEPYAGGAGVAIELLLSGAVAHIHLNDSSIPLHAFWRSVVYHTEEFCRRIGTVPLSVEQWRRQKEIFARPWEFDQIDLGFSMFYLNRCNRSGIDNGGLIGGLKQNGKWRMDARFPRKELIRRVEAIGGRHGAITLRNWDAERFVTQHLPTLPSRSLIYFDPPYFHKAERLYHNHYAPGDHERIAKIVQRRVSQPWLISYDYTPEILAFYSDRRKFSYELQYNAAKAYKGRELIVLGDGLLLPAQSGLPFIDRGLRTLRATFSNHRFGGHSVTEERTGVDAGFGRAHLPRGREGLTTNEH